MPIGTGEPDAFRDRKTMRSTFAIAAALTCAVFCVSPKGAGQAAGVNQGGPDYIHAPASPITQSSGGEAALKLDQMRQAERHRHVVADSAKLVELASQLKVEIDGAPKDQLSLGAIRKAAEIEKLAHDLKDWLKS